MKHTPHPPEAAASPDRRAFMGLTLCVPAAAAGAVLGLGTLPAEAVAVKPAVEPGEHRGYHRSAHIDTYYASLSY